MTGHRLYPAGSRELLRQAAKAADEETPHVMTHPLLTCPTCGKEYYGPQACPWCAADKEKNV